MKMRWWIAIFLSLCIGLLAWNAGRVLLVNEPERADAILVLAGETDKRPNLGIRLLQGNFAPVMVLDVPVDQRVYHWTQPELAEHWLASLPEAAKISVCPVYGLSTKEEAHDAAACLRKLSAKTVLLVTSDYHTRRASSIFRHELPGMKISVAAAAEPRAFGVKWWQQREWAKTTFYEWIRLIWWEVVDRWR